MLAIKTQIKETSHNRTTLEYLESLEFGGIDKSKPISKLIKNVATDDEIRLFLDIRKTAKYLIDDLDQLLTSGPGHEDEHLNNIQSDINVIHGCLEVITDVTRRTDET